MRKRKYWRLAGTFDAIFLKAAEQDGGTLEFVQNSAAVTQKTIGSSAFLFGPLRGPGADALEAPEGNSHVGDQVTLDGTDGVVIVEEAVIERVVLFSAVGIEKHTGRDRLAASEYFDIVHGRSAAKLHSVFSIGRS
jgi:hypothetical protein